MKSLSCDSMTYFSFKYLLRLTQQTLEEIVVENKLALLVERKHYCYIFPYWFYFLHFPTWIIIKLKNCILSIISLIIKSKDRPLGFLGDRKNLMYFRWVISEWKTIAQGHNVSSMTLSTPWILLVDSCPVYCTVLRCIHSRLIIRFWYQLLPSPVWKPKHVFRR